jgi:hypothetical protein
VERMQDHSHRKKPEFWGSIRVGGKSDQLGTLGPKAIDDLVSDSRTFVYRIFPNLASDAREISEQVFAAAYRLGMRDRKKRSCLVGRP